MKAYKVAKWLNTDSADGEFAEVFALLELTMCGRGIPNNYNAESIILNMNVDSVCEKLKCILKDIQQQVEDGFLDDVIGK